VLLEHPPIQPADLKGRPLTKEEIEERLRGLGYKCLDCGAPLGRVVCYPAVRGWGVLVKGQKGLYIVVATCEECGARVELSQLIRLTMERRRGVKVW